VQSEPLPSGSRQGADGRINRLKQWRGIATRFDKRAVNYRAGAVIVSLLWLA
jgi:transposase